MVTSMQYATPSLLGLGDTSPQGAKYPDQGYDLVYDVVLNPNNLAAGLGVLRDFQQIEHDSDFIWRAVFVNASTGTFSVRFNNNGWYYYSNAPMLSTNLQGDASSPYPWWPESRIPAGGRIGIDLVDLTGAANTIEIVFRGIKRFV